MSRSGVAHPPPDGPSIPVLIALGLLSALLLAAVPFQSLRGGLLILLALTGCAVLAAVAAFARRRLVDVLYLALVATASVPIDRYFGYREHVGGWPGLRFAVVDLFLLALVPLAVLGWARGRIRNGIPAGVMIIYGLWLLQYSVSILGAREKELAAFEMASAVHALLLAVIAAALFRRQYVKPILMTFAALLSIHTVFAAVQAATGRSFDILGAGSAKITVESFTTGAERLRPAGLLGHPIVYANFLMIGLPIVAAGILLTRSKALRVGFSAVFLAGLSGLALTLSRGAWISSVVAAAALIILASRYGMLDRVNRRRLRYAGLAAAVLIVLVFGPLIFERLTASLEGNLRVRFELNEIARRMIAAHPFSGVGLNNFIEAMEGYDPKDVMEYFPATVHNLYLLEASEAGIPALLLFLALWGSIFTAALSHLPAADRELRWLAIALIAGLLGFLVTQLADFSHRLEPLRSVLWVNVGLLFGALRVAPRPGAVVAEGKA